MEKGKTRSLTAYLLPDLIRTCSPPGLVKTMFVLLLTVFLSTCLAVFFILGFVYDRKRRGSGSAEQDALIPFRDEPAGNGTPKPASRS